MKSKLGFEWYEYPSGRQSYRQAALQLYPVSMFDAVKNLKEAIEGGHEWRIKRDTDIIRGAAGRQVVYGGNYVTINWQASNDFDHWYAPSISLHCGHPFGNGELCALQVRIAKVAAAMKAENSPADWAIALGAFPIERIPEADKGSINNYDYRVVADWPGDTSTIYGPAGKVAPAPAESECAG